MTSIRLYFLISLLFLFSCHQPSDLTPDEKIRITGEIRQTLNNYFDDIRKSGLSAEFKYLDSSENFFWVPPGYSESQSYAIIAKAIRENTLKFKSVDNSFEKLVIHPLSKDLASYSGQINSILTDTSGQIIRFSLVESGVLIKRVDGWKLQSGQTSVVGE